MAATSIIGDVAETVKATITLPVPITVVGVSSTGVARISELANVRRFASTAGNIRVVGDIRCEVFGPITSTQAVVACVALYPDKYPDAPTSQAEVEALEGRVFVQQSLAFGSQSGSPAWPRETTPQLVPKTLVDYPPVVAYHVSTPGGTATTRSTLTLHLTLEVHGVCHQKTW